MSDQPILQARGVFKSYQKNHIEVPVLRGVDLDVTSGEITALVGRSGSGKSTLMHLLATLDQPDRGEILFRGARIDNSSRRERMRFATVTSASSSSSIICCPSFQRSRMSWRQP